MLKRLRLKFVVINMAIVTIMLAVIFSLMYASTSRNMERESLRMMEAAARNPRQTAMPDKPREDMQLPFFSIQLDRDGNTVSVAEGSFDLSDEALRDGLIEKALSGSGQSGVLKEYNLRWLSRANRDGQVLVFSDMTGERTVLRNMIKAFSFIGLAAFLVFLAISILLARRSVKPVEQAWEQQRQFTADASHELKTPLTVIMTDAELLSSDSCSAEERRSLTEGILTMAGQMRGLVESLLDLARVEDGKKSGNYGPVSLSEAAGDAALVFEPVFFEKGLSLRYELEPGISVNGEASQLRQLAEILLDNASKYSSPGGETVMSLKMTQKKRCLLEVSNQGEQIPQEELENLFKRFYRADKARAMNHSYGLGLSIAQSIVEKHGGKIWAESSGGRNSFCCLLHTDNRQ